MLTRLEQWRQKRRQKLAAKTHAVQSDPAAKGGADAMRNPTPTTQQQRTTGG